MSSVSLQSFGARILAGLAVAAAMAQPARADTVLTFATPSCEPGFTGVPIGTSVSPYVSNGFTIIPTSSLASWCATAPGFAGPAAFINEFGGGATLSAVGGGAFGITSIDLASLFTGSPLSGPLFFTGHLSGGGTVEQTFDTALGATTPPAFSTFVFSSSFQNLTSLDFASQAIALYQFRNIHLTSATTTTTPEPTTLFLAATGIAAIAAVRRRKRR